MAPLCFRDPGAACCHPLSGSSRIGAKRAEIHHEEVSRARLVILLLACSVFGWALSSRLAVLLQIEGAAVPVSSGAVSEHDLEELKSLPPEGQAARLLEKAVNHYRGAAEEIGKRLDGWRGNMQPSKELEN